jgi:hypothetical protein
MRRWERRLRSSLLNTFQMMYPGTHSCADQGACAVARLTHCLCWCTREGQTPTTTVVSSHRHESHTNPALLHTHRCGRSAELRYKYSIRLWNRVEQHADGNARVKGEHSMQYHASMLTLACCNGHLTRSHPPSRRALCQRAAKHAIARVIFSNGILPKENLALKIQKLVRAPSTQPLATRAALLCLHTGNARNETQLAHLGACDARFRCRL